MQAAGRWATASTSSSSSPNVELVDTGIDHVEARGIVTADGVLHELDVIVLATGFDAHAFVRPMELIGPGGLQLSEVWDDASPTATASVALPGFPNVLMLIGPHSPFGNQSLFMISETQQDFAMGLIERWRRGEIEAMAPHARGDRALQRRAARGDAEHDLDQRLQELVHRQGRPAARMAMAPRAPPRDARRGRDRRLGSRAGPRGRGAVETTCPQEEVRMAGQFEGSVVIDRPIEEVFAFVADGENDQKFSDRVLEIAKTTDGPVGVGTVFESTVKDGGVKTQRKFEITEFEAPTRIRWIERSQNPIVVPEGGYDLEPVGEGETKLRLYNVLEPGNLFGKLITGFALRAARKDVDGLVNSIKRAVEAS